MNRLVVMVYILVLTPAWCGICTVISLPMVSWDLQGGRGQKQ